MYLLLRLELRESQSNPNPFAWTPEKTLSSSPGNFTSWASFNDVTLIESEVVLVHKSVEKKNIKIRLSSCMYDNRALK